MSHHIKILRDAGLLVINDVLIFSLPLPLKYVNAYY
ncbi:hypothetical protein [Dyadobacter chenwenxiniae]